MSTCKQCGTFNTVETGKCSRCDSPMKISEQAGNTGAENFAQQLKRTVEKGKLPLDRAPGQTKSFAEQLAGSEFAVSLEKIQGQPQKNLSFKSIVTSPCFDDIGAVLKRLKIPFRKYKDKFDCDLFFLNCGTSDHVPIKKLQDFVKKGGVLYASDLTSSTINEAFPGIFNFEGSGVPGSIEAIIIDQELRSVIGSRIKVEFDLTGWSILKSISRGEVIMISAVNQLPIMVVVPVEKGKVIYTCFHNHAQVSRHEEILLELLVLKQVGISQKLSLKQTCMSMGIQIDNYKNEVKSIKN